MPAQTVVTHCTGDLLIPIAQGRYEIDAEKIADRLIESTRESLRGAKA